MVYAPPFYPSKSSIIYTNIFSLLSVFVTSITKKSICLLPVFRYIDGVRKGKLMTFLNTRPLSTTPSGLPIAPLSTSFLMSDYFKNLPSKCYVSPDEVILCVDNKQNMYCHLLCGLVQREEVVSISAAFASYLVQANPIS